MFFIVCENTVFKGALDLDNLTGGIFSKLIPVRTFFFQVFSYAYSLTRLTYFSRGRMGTDQTKQHFI
jgi:hypothetical protein